MTYFIQFLSILSYSDQLPVGLIPQLRVDNLNSLAKLMGLGHV